MPPHPLGSYCRAKADLFKLVAQHTYGLPPARRRRALEQPGDEAPAARAGRLAAALAGTEVLHEAKLAAAAAKAYAVASRLADVPVHAAELADLRRWPLDGASSRGSEQGHGRAAEQSVDDLDENLLREAAELDADLGIETMDAAEWEVVPSSPEGSLIGKLVPSLPCLSLVGLLPQGCACPACRQ